jgi:hypothetical protein
MILGGSSALYFLTDNAQDIGGSASLRPRAVYAGTKFVVGTAQMLSGSGAPNVAAPVGSTYSRTDGGASTSFYVKETGTGTSGWVAYGAGGGGGGGGGAPLFNPNSFVGLNMDPISMSVTGTAMVSGTVYVFKVPVLTSTAVTYITMYQSTAGATLTAGQCFAALYDSTGAQVGVTADQSTAWGTSGTKSMPLVTPTGPRTAGETMYVAVVANGTTGPVFRAAASGLPNIGLVAAQGFRFGTSGTAQTAAPASLTIASIAQQATHQAFVGLL